MPLGFGWLLGVVLGAVLAVAGFTALSMALPGILGPFGALALTVSIGVVVALVVLAYILAYALATRSLTPVLPAVTFPVALPVPTPGGVSVPVASPPGELFARGMTIGLTAILNAAILALVPVSGGVLSVWAFVIVSLAIITPIARSPIYHGFLGWTGWILPLSWLATIVGLLLFVVNLPIALALGTIAAFRLDWSTGVAETAGGVSGITGFVGGFSLGNFNFLTTMTLQDNFLGRGISAHETGHSLNTAAFGGIVLWINAVDENVPPMRRMNLAYGELTAESHAQGLPVIPGAPWVDFFVRTWG